MNILGEGFDDYVSNQINVRQEKYAVGLGENRTMDDITFMNSKTAFARLMSSVEVSPGGTNYTYVNGLNLNSLDLAKKYVLFAGTSTSTPGLQRSGLDLDQAYGIGGYELGYRPMPGIEKVDIKTDGDGYTKSATINIKAYNRQQLEILDVLYMRLGYYMLLEWGNVIYWDNNKNLVNDPYNNSLQDYFFNKSNTSVNKTLEKIQEKRISSSGNYDALFGKVMNFSWNYNADNSFNITLNLRSVGDIIEGLKMNTQKTVTNGNNKPTTGGSEEFYQYKHGISNLYHLVKTRILTNGGYFQENKSTITFEGDKTFCRVPFNGGNMQYYVKLNRLLAEIQNNYIFILNEDNSETTIKIDYDVETNLIPINELTISVDPRICIVSRTDTVKPKELFPDVTQISDTFQWNFYDYLDSFIYSEIPEVIYGKLMNVYVNFDYLNKKIDELVDEKTNKVSMKRFLNAILGDISRALGGVNQLEVNITDDNVLRIIDKNPYPKLDELLTKFKKNKTISKFNITGYYNPQNKQNTTSFVKDLSFQTSIPPEFAIIISIGAAANKQVVGEDTTAFSKLSQGLTTRFAEKITEGQNSKIASGSLESPDQIILSSATYFNYVVNGSVKGGISLDWNEETFESNKSILNSLVKDLNKRKSNEGGSNSTISPTSGFIPVNVSLTMDGLSGMKIFQRFDLDSTFLPSNYPNNLDILIKSITHKIQNNIWDTTIESVIVGKSSTGSSSTKSSTSSSSSSKDSKAASRGYVEQKVTPSNGNCKRDQSIIISKNFNLAQLSCSAPAAAYLIPGEGQTKYFKFEKQNLTRQQVINNLKALAENILEPIKAKYPDMFVTNAYRNKGNGSQHEGGQAVDIQFSDIRGKTNQNDLMVTRVKEIQTLLKGKKGYDQLLLEYRAGNNPWIHISFSTTALRNQALTLVDDVTRFRNEFKNPYA